MKCPNQKELGRAFSTGAGAELGAHLGDCPICAARWNGFAQLRALAQRLPEPVLDAESRQRARDAVVARSADARRGRRWALVAVAALGVLGTLLAATVALLRAPALRATVHALPGATLEHVGPTTDERVRLHDGTIALEVAPLRAGERFRVLTSDAEVEVRGTAFEVVASSGRLLAVRVSHGRVEVRPQGAAATTLAANETWTRPTAAAIAAATDSDADTDAATATATVTDTATATVTDTATAPVAPPRTRTPSRPRAPRLDSPTPAVSPPPPPAPAPAPKPEASPTELAFDEGFAALRANAPAEAAAAFARAAAAGGELAEDASFWRAVALRRAGRTEEALAAFVTFLDRYPRSQRAGEAAVAAGWLELDAGRTDAAEAHFRAAADDPAPRVRASAADGLRAVTGK